MKECPFCAEEIQDAAIKCKHCGEFLDGRPRQVEPTAQPSAPVKQANRPWHLRDSTILMAVFIFLPFALPLVWINRYYSLRTKIVITVIVGGVSIWLWHITSDALKVIGEYESLLF